MAAAILNQGKTAIRDAIKAQFAFIAISTDATAFAATQTVVDPANAGGTTILIQASTVANSGANNDQFDATVTVTGATQFTNQNINTISGCTSNARTAANTRSVRSQPIGVQSGDVFTIGLRVLVQDNS